MPICQNCGHDSDKTIANKPISHIMSRYVNEKDSKDVTVLNDNRAKVVAGEKTWILESVYNKVAAQAQTSTVVATAPVTPATK